VAVVLAAAVPYLPALRYGFVYDDHGAIEENAFLRNPANIGAVLALQTFRDALVLDGQRPVLLLTHFAERAVWGLNPFGYHLTNLLLHLAAVVLVYLLAGRILPKGAPPLLAAVLFGLHPALTEALQVPSFREDLLATVFVLGSILCAKKSIIATVVFHVLALLSKETALVVPGLLAALWFFFPRERPGSRAMAAILALGVLLDAVYLSALHFGRGLQAAAGVWNGYAFPFPSNFLAGPPLFAEYLRLLLVPWPLIADRVFDLPASMHSFKFLSGLLVVMAVAVLALHARRGQPVAGWGLAWVVLAFLPVSNLVPLYNPMADRYLYFMAPGFVLVMAAALRPPAPLILAVVYAFLTFARLPDWRDDYALWMKTGRQEPRSARAHTWIGLEMKARGHSDVAARHFRDADRINPQDVSALINLGILDAEAGDLPGAEAKFREAIRRRPDKREARVNLEKALELQKNMDLQSGGALPILRAH
jgi:tetratricopeptide (TPR) repeat protein